jgi:RNA-directed DNA polymerase
MGTKVPGLQLHNESGTETADSAESGAPAQRASSGIDATEQGRQHGQDGREINQYLRGWIGYFGKCQTPSVLEGLDQWVRRRLRSAIWRQWRLGSTKFAKLRQRGVGKDLAAQTAGSAHGPWRIADSPGLHIALPNAYFDSLGIPRLTALPIA